MAKSIPGGLERKLSMDRNLFMSSQEAKDYGIIDGIFGGGELRT